MFGAIAGDIIGSRFEFANIHTKVFDLFIDELSYTDDTVLTIAVADALMNGEDYFTYLRRYTKANPHRGYGARYYDWSKTTDPKPYNSFGNGSAMRVSPVAYAFNDIESVMDAAERSAAVTHNHPEGIKGAQATASAIFMARTGCTKEVIRDFTTLAFSYDLERTVDDIREVYTYNESCQGTVPEAIICFLESSSYEDAIRNAISIGGDSDTLACITGSIAEAFYGGIPEDIKAEILRRLPADFITVLTRFEQTFQQTTGSNDTAARTVPLTSIKQDWELREMRPSEVEEVLTLIKQHFATFFEARPVAFDLVRWEVSAIDPSLAASLEGKMRSSIEPGSTQFYVSTREGKIIGVYGIHPSSNQSAYHAHDPAYPALADDLLTAAYHKLCSINGNNSNPTIRRAPPWFFA